jgi:hypothetical protein
VEGFPDKFEASDQAVVPGGYHRPRLERPLAEVEASNLPAVITFSITFDPSAGDISTFEITKIEGKATYTDDDL